MYFFSPHVTMNLQMVLIFIGASLAQNSLLQQMVRGAESRALLVSVEHMLARLGNHHFRVFRVVTGCVRVVSRDVARCRKTPSDLGRIDEAAGVGRFI